MSIITRKELLSAARLAAIEIDSSEEEYYIKHLNNIVSVLQTVEEAIVPEGTEPIISITETKDTPTRQDIINDGNCVEKVLANAKSEFDCFIVPKVIDAGE